MGGTKRKVSVVDLSILKRKRYIYIYIYIYIYKVVVNKN